MRRRKVVDVLIAACGFMAVEGSAQDKTKSTPAGPFYTELAKAPEKSRTKQNPLSKDPEAPAAGEILFEEHCTECHGQHGEGGKKAPTLRAAEVQEASDGTIFWVLTNGVVRKGMPVWSKLPEPQRWQLISYIKSLGVAEVGKKAEGNNR